MKKFQSTFALTAFVVLNCFSQLQNRYWYFGENAGIDFGSTLNTPTYTGIGNNQGEGVASISDLSGKFLFYTDGRKILKGLNNPISAKLFGNGSSSQSSIIVPSPGSCDIFYIFTVDECYNANSQYNDSIGLQFVTINTNTWTVSNSQLLNSSCCEKVTAIPHTNGKDYWIISTKTASKEVLIYLLNSNGVKSHKTMTVSALPNEFQKGRFGYLKSSSDGTLVAIASGFEGNLGKNGNLKDYPSYKSWVDLLRFDPSKGDIVFLKTFETFINGTKTDTITGAYGVEFSPNGNNLFISGLGWNGNKKGYLYCFSTSSPYKLIDYETITSSVSSSYVAGALQLGPDNKIYLAQQGTTKLGVIANPNKVNFDFSTDFNQNGLNLNCTNCKIGLGLPNLLPRFNSCTPAITFDPCCPPMNKELMKTLFRFIPTGTISDPYQVSFNPTNFFNNISQSYCDYIYALYPSINQLTYSWELRKAGTGAIPKIQYNNGVGANPTVYNWFVPKGNGVLKGNTVFFDGLLNINEWYAIHVGMYTEPVTTAFSKDCSNNTIIYIIIKVEMGIRRATISDGQKILSEFIVEPMEKKN